MMTDQISPGVVAVGFCCIDIYENINESYATGNGIDWGIHLKRMGIQVSIVSAVGNDIHGSMMKDALLNENLDISHLRTVSGNTCITRMDLKNGTDRIHLETIDGVMEDYCITEDEFDFVARHKLLHTDLFGNVISYLPAWKECGVKIIMDFSVFSRDPLYHCMDIFPYVDYVFFSADGINDLDLKPWMEQIHACGCQLVTATLGERGSLCYDGSRFYSCNALPTKVVNTVGAGDSYIAGFTYGILNDFSIPDCMKLGTKTATKVISEFRPY